MNPKVYSLIKGYWDLWAGFQGSTSEEKPSQKQKSRKPGKLSLFHFVSQGVALSSPLFLTQAYKTLCVYVRAYVSR